LRDRAMLHLAYAGGLRVSELVGLHLADLVLHPQPTIHVMGKGRREVTVQPLKSCIKRKSEESCIWAWPFETKPGKLDV